jgi:hypothetical protein
MKLFSTIFENYIHSKAKYFQINKMNVLEFSSEGFRIECRVLLSLQ